MRTYKNPVYANYFADPFVWKHDGNYYAVGTGPISGEAHGMDTAMSSSKIRGEERAFPLLISNNFVEWKFSGGALRVPDFAIGGDFWAPEVAFDGHNFFLYYSVATEGLNHQLRVARSAKPAGPFEDIGALTQLETLSFAIDPHPFRDDDGRWYLFYARDFLDATGEMRAGTAIVVDQLIGMSRLAGKENVVLRSRRNWQLFQAQRNMYGKVFDWHTLEGPCLRRHEGKYFCFYSGGCYENETYGVDYGVAENILGPYHEAGNESGPRVLRSVPGRVVGPGHTSIVIGPDDKTEYMVYHAWDVEMKARRMCIDKLLWTKDGPRCQGPTWTAQEIAIG